MPLFTLGVLGFLFAVFAWLTADGRGGTVMLYVAATGLSLGTFGIHNDTALALLASDAAGGSAARAERPPQALADELAAERRRDAINLAALKATPKTAWGITLIALSLHVWAASRLLPSLAEL